MSSVMGRVQSVENEERETEKIEIIVINHKKMRITLIKTLCMYLHISTMRRALKRLDALAKVKCACNVISVYIFELEHWK